MRTIATLTLVLLATAAGCKPTDEVTASGNRDVVGELGTGAPGVYVLRSIAGQPLPAVVTSHESYHAVMVADTIFLHADGWGGDAAVKRVTEDPAAGERLVREDGAFQYEVSGSRLTGEYPCNDVIVLAACAAPPHLTGMLRADGLDLDMRIASRSPLRYEKVAGPSHVAAIRITPSDDLVVGVGSTLQLSVAARDAQGQTLPARTAAWRAFPTSHATVSGGTVRGVARGVAYVIATMDGRPDTVRVTVR